VNNRGPLTPTGIYQVVARRGRQCGVNVYPHRFRYHFSHTWLDRGEGERDLMELNGWTSLQCISRSARNGSQVPSSILTQRMAAPGKIHHQRARRSLSRHPGTSERSPGRSTHRGAWARQNGETEVGQRAHSADVATYRVAFKPCCTLPPALDRQ
jgi:hypothetical protein